MSIEELVRQLVTRNDSGRSRAAAAHSSVLESLTTGGELDVDGIFEQFTADEVGSGGPSGPQGETQPVAGDDGGTETST